MIKKIFFKNYRIFKEQQTLALRPLTVIFGKNNTGKSAVVRLPALLAASFNGESGQPLELNNDGLVFGAELRDLVYGKANRMLEFGLDFESELQNHHLEVGILVTTDRGIQSAIIDYWRLGESISLQATADKNIFNDALNKLELRCEFQGLTLTKCQQLDGSPAPFVLPEFNMEFSTDFIGPIRVMPQRDYRVSSASRTASSGLKGEHTYLTLIEDALTTDKVVSKKVGNWYRDNFEGWSLSVNQDKAPIFQVEIQRESLKQNIVDTGIGMSQVFPIVTRALTPCANKTLILIEEPETHLHPAAHANLAELIADTLKDNDREYLIETHSLNFILRLRRLIVEGKLKPEQLGLYYVDFLEKENYSQLEEIKVDELGRVSKWPGEIFNETLQETVSIRNAQLDKEGHDY